MTLRVTGLLCVCLLFLFGGCVSAPSTLLPAPRDKLLISADGMYRVTAADLRSVGIDLGRIDPATLQLFRADREVAIRVMGAKDNLAIEFYGEANDSPYSRFSVYWLRWGVEKGMRMREIALAPPSSLPKESFQDSTRIERPTSYIPQSGAASLWFWQSLTAPVTITIAVTLPAALPAPVQLRVNLWGSTEDPAVPNHHLILFFNDARVADEKWSGKGEHPIDAAAPAAAVHAGENTLRLVAPGDTRAQADIVLLTSIEVTYTRRFVADAPQDALTFPGSHGTFRVDGFSGDAVELYDITDPTTPAHATVASIAARAVSFSDDTDSPRYWLAVGPTGYKSPARIAPMTSSDLRSSDRQADYIVITHPDFVEALKPLVQWREQHGLKVSVVTTNEIYDEFGFGAESPLAIRAFIGWAYREWARPAPRFVLLVGKASYDYRDDLNAPNKNLLPTFLVTTPHLGQAASDNWYVAADARPTMAIGRIPAKTADQVANVVQKIIAFESAQSADWRRRAVFVADDKDPSFSQMSDEMAAQTRMQVRKVYLAAHNGDVKTTRAEIIQDWNAGAGLVTYTGHGSIDTWAAGPLLSVTDLTDLRNGARLPVLITPTCLDGFFYHPQRDSLAEELLFEKDGGIVAGVVPTGLGLPEAQGALMRALFDELAMPGATLGDALLRAKQKMPGDSPDLREVIDTFVLLGDPALSFQLGN